MRTQHIPAYHLRQVWEFSYGDHSMITRLAMFRAGGNCNGSLADSPPRACLERNLGMWRSLVSVLAPEARSRGFESHHPDDVRYRDIN